MAVLNKRIRRILGLVFNSTGLMFVIIGTVLDNIQYKFINANFREDNPFASVGQLQLATTVFSYWVIAITYIGIFKANFWYILSLVILTAIAAMWNISIAVQSIVAGSPGWVSSYYICEGHYNGLFGLFHDIDAYMQSVDQILCSKGCPCYFDEVSQVLYQQNMTLNQNGNLTPLNYPFNFWVKTNDTGGAANFQACSPELKYFAYKEAKRLNPKFDPDRNFNEEKFFRYFRNVEEKFKCRGWCRLYYFNPDYNSMTFIDKYLFSNINGPIDHQHQVPPPHLGCFDSLMSWLPGYLVAWGAMALCGASCQVALVGLGISQLHEWEEEYKQGYIRKDSPNTADEVPVN